MLKNFLVFLLFTPQLFAGNVKNEDNATTVEDGDDSVFEPKHGREKRAARRNFIIKCCGLRTCQGENLRNRPDATFDPDAEIPGQNTPTLAQTCAELPFGKLASCCQGHPKIFDYMDMEIRVCTNRTSNPSDYQYYKTVLLEYILNQATTMKNRIDLRRVPMAVKFMDCFFTERGWFDATKPELYTKTLVEEFIDNIEMSWDDVMTDAIVNCSLVIRASNQPLTLMLPSPDDLNQKQSYLAFPFQFVQCVRKVLLMYCPTPNKPVVNNFCIDLRSKFKQCDPLPKTSNPKDEYEDEYYYEDDNSGGSDGGEYEYYNDNSRNPGGSNNQGAFGPPSGMQPNNGPFGPPNSNPFGSGGMQPNNGQPGQFGPPNLNPFGGTGGVRGSLQEEARNVRNRIRSRNNVRNRDRLKPANENADDALNQAFGMFG